MVRYAILGPVELCDGERRVALGGPGQLALLALLLVNANRALSNDRLIDALWGDRGPAGASKRLQMAVARLRRTLDPEGVAGQSVLRTVAGGYLLAVRPGELDSEVFGARAEEGRRALEAGEAARAREALGRALGMWRGPALADVAYEEFAQPEIGRLEELRLMTLETRMDCELRLGEHSALIGELEGLVAAHPGRERLAWQLMLALYRCGRQGEALEVHARTRAYLSGELGLEPGPALRTLQAEILAQSPRLQPASGGPEAVTAAGAVGCRVAPEPVVLTLPRALRFPTGLPFVGREGEFARLRERWNEVNDVARSAVIVGGEAGIGKTRLASELAQAVHGEGGLVLYGRCDEGLAVPYQPFVEALRPYARAVGVDRLRAELGDLAADLGRLLPELRRLGEPVRGDPESERFALFETITALIEAMTRERKALLVLDDLHWAATPTLTLLRHVIRSERPLGVLLVGAYRETELDLGGPLAQLLADLQRDASTERMSLRGLDEPAITALLEATVGQAPTTAELVRALQGETAGNPFFLRELLAVLRKSGTSSEADRLDTDVIAAQLAVPEGLRHVIGQRVARLSAPVGRALPIAAVAGATFSCMLLERVLGEGAGALDALDDAVAAGLLTEAGHGEYAFAHALVRQTIYGQLGSARRMRLHRQLGEAIETLGDTDAHAEALAYHFAQAAADGQAAKAADYALAAGASATARLGYEEAVAHYERGLQALTLSEQAQERRRCELLLALGAAHWDAGELDKARQVCQQAAELAEQLDDPAALGRAALGFCGPHRAELATEAIRPAARLLQRALARLGEHDSALRAQLMARLAFGFAIAEQPRKPALAREAIEIARRVADKATLADVLASTLWVIRGPDTPQESITMAVELGRVADEIGHRRLRANAHAWLLDFLLELGDIDAVQRELHALQLLAQTHRQRQIEWLVAVVRAGHAHLQGRLDDCEALAHDALTHRYEGYDETAIRLWGLQTYFVRSEQGRLDELLDAAESYAEHYPRLTGWRCELAYIYAQLERTTQARQQLQALAHADFADITRDANWLWSLSTLSELVVLLDDAPRAQMLYKLLLPYADRCVVPFALLCRGSASRPLGLLATTLTRYEDAARHFEHALKMNAQIRSPLWIAHTQHDYARTLLLRNHAGDRDKAIKLLTQALASADRLGLKALADKARPLKQAALATDPSPLLSRPL